MPNVSKQRVALYAATEVVVPGASNLLQKNFKTGFAHLVAGVAASAVYGPAGMLLVAANSLHKSVTGDHLYERLGVLQPASETAPAPAPVEPPPATVSDIPVTRGPEAPAPKARNRPPAS